MKTQNKRTIEVCLTPGLFQYRQSDGELITVVVDIFRAGSSIVAALDGNFIKVKPVAGAEKARKLKLEKGWPAAGERNGIKLDFTDFGNSPVALSQAQPSSHPLILTTSNGTKAIEVAKLIGEVIIGGFNNIDAVKSYLADHSKNILILCSGWMGSMSMEDTLFAGALIRQMSAETFRLLNDEALMAMQLWESARINLKQYLKKATHFQRLVGLGAEADIEYALTFNNSNNIPRLDGDFLTNLKL